MNNQPHPASKASEIFNSNKDLVFSSDSLYHYTRWEYKIYITSAAQNKRKIVAAL